MASSAVLFCLFTLMWEIAVGLIYGFLFGYSEVSFTVSQLTANLPIIAVVMILIIVGK
jgi:hypothetical protein